MILLNKFNKNWSIILLLSLFYLFTETDLKLKSAQHLII